MEQRAERDPLTYRVIGAYMGVYRALGWGFLEAVYQRALCVELQHSGIAFAAQPLSPVQYRGVLVGEYRADLIVENSIIVELKVAEMLTGTHRAQLLNYLKATTIERGLLFNFGPKPAFERLILTNDRKQPRPLKL